MTKARVRNRTSKLLVLGRPLLIPVIDVRDREAPGSPRNSALRSSSRAVWRMVWFLRVWHPPIWSYLLTPAAACDGQ